jgi:putative membrane protein
MRKQFRCVLAATAALMLVGAPTFAQQERDLPQGASVPRPPAGGGGQIGGGGNAGRPPAPSGQPERAPSPKANPDEKFVKDAALGSLAEVEIGRLAAQKATSAEVKQFAQRMVDDHGKANAQLSTIAAQKSIATPTELTGKEKKALDKLSKASAEDFDRTYMRMMVDDHKKDVTEFKKAASSATDSDVKTFASSTLPTLEGHLRMAQQIADSQRDVRATSGTRDNTRPTDRGGVDAGRPEPIGGAGRPDPGSGRPDPGTGRPDSPNPLPNPGNPGTER